MRTGNFKNLSPSDTPHGQSDSGSHSPAGLALQYAVGGTPAEVETGLPTASSEITEDFQAAIEELRSAINVCQWQRYDHLQRVMQSTVRHTNGWVCGETSLASPHLGAKDLLACAERNALAVLKDAAQNERSHNARRTALPYSAEQFRAEVKRSPGKLRVGFLGRDFFNQATSYLMVGMIEAHDRDTVEYIAYDYGAAADDELRRRMKSAFDNFHVVQDLSNEDLATRIRSDGIDILLFLQNPADARCGVLALRPAPVQLAYLYYPGSFGAGLVDAIIADRVTIPPELEDKYSEGIIRLPHCYQPNDSSRILPLRNARQSFGFPPDHFVLANFGQPYKITPAMFDVWCSILRQHPQTVLCLLAPEETVVDNLVREACKRGVTASRLFFQPVVSTELHISRLSCVDLMLDTYPYGAHTGTSDALWAGTPVLTLIGETFASRVAASLLHEVALDQLVATREQEYVAIATSLIEIPARLSSIKRHLVGKRHSFALFDSRTYASTFERMLHQLAREFWHPAD
ncbi:MULTISPECIES: O-linked N-acetylglucosamine transferase, SPINDLY family protein [Paraburkholderia]|uniref:O-linked N-acetylglucosamine transferase, SPINDLY family protein n=1 Tax=Paraburkholderia TaxID=1822464 RepID=UPI00224E1031|nr:MULTISPECIES: hypothetical protein [Paraburkholderia]MCX4159645.1 hypothetical protein [Paraburkholderia aspalathi]MDN7169043.1 hypothetical protein [Paraburkholderia sp. SECH2]MDQ6397530.1 hypothetical protein [Paraburkholderia aspalathi]